MTAIIIAIIALIIMFLFFIIMLMITRTQKTTLTTIDEDGKIKDEKGSIEEEIEKKSKAKSSVAKNTDSKESISKVDVFKFMEFDRILDDMIVQKGGSRFTKAIKCKGINYDLMSEVEQLSVEEGFITFLNTLKYPIQLYVQAQNVDLKKTMAIYKQNTKSIEDQYNDVNNRYQKMASSFDTDERKMAELTNEKDSITNVWEYARDMIKYVEKMDKNKKMLQRSFYILVSYNTADITSVEKFNKNELIEMCNTELTTRCQAIISALTSCSVSGTILDSNELAELLYNAYNRDDAGVMNVKENIEAGFFRLYSVSEDAFTKKQEALEDYLDAQARLKALESIKYAILNDNYNTPAMEQLNEEEEISRRATNMVNAEDYNKEFKDKVNKKILSDYRDVKKELLREDAEEKQIIIEQSKKDDNEIENLKKKVNDFEKQNNIIKNDDSKPLLEQEKQVPLSEDNNSDNLVVDDSIKDKILEQSEKKQENTILSNNADVSNLYSDSVVDDEDESII